MQDRVTAKQIAQALGMSERAARDKATKESWPFEEVSCRGGKRRVYPLGNLPADIRQALGRVAASETATAGRCEALKTKLDVDMDARITDAARQAGLAKLVCLDDKARSRAEARAILVAALEAFLQSTGKPVTTGQTLFAEAYNAGEIDVEPFVRELIPSTCANTLANWQKKVAKEGISSLAGKYGHRKGSGLAEDVEIAGYIEAFLTDFTAGTVGIAGKSATLTIARGVVDTTPAAHAAGARVWFIGWTDYGLDETVYLQGLTARIKACPRTARGVLALASASENSLEADARAIRPYPPANVRINGAYYPAALADNTAITVTWDNRNRLNQTGGLFTQAAGNILPETGTTISIYLYDADIRPSCGAGGQGASDRQAAPVARGSAWGGM